MCDNEFWIKFWTILLGCIASVFTVGTLCATVSGYHQRDIMAEMVRAGYSPMAASCAVAGVGQNEQVICATAAGAK